MPFNSREELPDRVRKVLPAHAQEIYLSAYNNAWDEYKRAEKRRDADRETVAHKVAWSAVKQVYEKGESGRWRKTSEGIA